jgi:AraC-like DNA-binding protein
MPGERLRPYISTFYLTEVKTDGDERIADWLHPEWANIRYSFGTMPFGSIGSNPEIQAPRIAVVGPTSYATQFESGTMKAWGVGLLPMGWSKFAGASAEQYADRTTDGEEDAHFEKFRPLYSALFENRHDGPESEADRIDRFFTALLDGSHDDDQLIQKAHNLLIDPDLQTVQEMAERLNVTGRTLDRLSRKAFGFPPKLLLRRQRFLRTLAENMLNPSQNWVSTLDSNYYDQAHFGRDFQRFMGMSATEYKAKSHPFMNAAVHGRMAAAGAGMQVLHDPKVGD